VGAPAPTARPPAPPPAPSHERLLPTGASTLTGARPHTLPPCPRPALPQVVAAPLVDAFVRLPSPTFGSPSTRKDSGYANNPMQPSSGGTVTIRGTLTNRGGATLPKGTPLSLWVGTDPQFGGYTFKPCTPPTLPATATTMLPRAVAPGRTVAFTFPTVGAGSVPAGKAYDGINALVLADPACERAAAHAGQGGPRQQGASRLWTRQLTALAAAMATPHRSTPRRAAGTLFTKATTAPYDTLFYALPNGAYPFLTPFVTGMSPSKPAPGGTIKVTVGVRNDGTADGKVRWMQGILGARRCPPSCSAAPCRPPAPCPHPSPSPLPPAPAHLPPQIGAIAAWNDAVNQAGTPCASEKTTVLTPAFDVTIPPGGVATVSFDLPAVSDAGVWRTLWLQLDAGCAMPRPAPDYYVGGAVGALYSTQPAR
jgi:hypothetical protein